MKDFDDNDWLVVEKMAADLSAERVDLNVAAQASTYLKAVRNTATFFLWLDQTNRTGSIRGLIRSKQTQGYYERLREVCNHYLKGMEFEKANKTLAWALRVARYYTLNPSILAQEDPRLESVSPAVTTTNTSVQEKTPAPAIVPSLTQSTPPPAQVGTKLWAQVAKIDKGSVELTITTPVGESAKPIKWSVRKAIAQNYEWEVGQAIEVEVSVLNDYEKTWAIDCIVVSGAKRKSNQGVTPVPARQDLRNNIIDQMNREWQAKKKE